MKHQYVGDISDYRKYALLRALADGGKNRIGVCWMLTPPDGRTDGNKLGYLSQPERYRDFDPLLFDLLAEAAAEPDQRRLHAIEDSGVIPCATYFNDELGASLAERQAYMTRCRSQLAGSNLVFFDPDNGLAGSIAKGRKNSGKFVYLDEIATFHGDGKSILVYQHFPRIEREAFIATCTQRLRDVAPGAELWAFRTKHVVFLLLIHPDHKASLGAAAERAAGRWHEDFIQVYRIEPETTGEVHATAPEGNPAKRTVFI